MSARKRQGAYQRLRREVGIKYWLEPNHVGPIARTESGEVIVGPRMTVVDDVCRAAWVCSLVIGVAFAVLVVEWLLALIDDPKMFLKGPVIFNTIIVFAGSGAAGFLLITCLRLDNLMRVVGSPLIGGIHNDWGGKREREDEENKETEEQQAAQAGGEPDFTLYLPDEDDGRTA